jgi:hypothetical protein
MVITSGGIYGFLSGAYQSTATQSELLDKSLMILNQKQIRFEETKEDLNIEKQGLTKSISDLRIALSNPAQVQYVDKESGQLITTSSSSARRALQSELKTTITERDNINIKIEAVMDSIGKTDMALLDKEISNEAESELGPLKYLSETTGQPMNKVVNWFLLMIIFVFDPLAIALVVAANMAFAQIRKPEDPKEDYFEKRNEHLNKVVMSVPEGKEFNKPYPISPGPSEGLKNRVKENQDKLKKEIGLDALIDIMEEEETEREQIIEVLPDSGHRVVTRDKPKEDIYKDKPDLGRTPNPIREKLQKPKNL